MFRGALAPPPGDSSYLSSSLRPQDSRNLYLSRSWETSRLSNHPWTLWCPEEAHLKEDVSKAPVSIHSDLPRQADLGYSEVGLISALQANHLSSYQSWLWCRLGAVNPSLADSLPAIYLEQLLDSTQEEVYFGDRLSCSYHMSMAYSMVCA